jgi:hypothetical protein
MVHSHLITINEATLLSLFLFFNTVNSATFISLTQYTNIRSEATTAANHHVRALRPLTATVSEDWKEAINLERKEAECFPRQTEVPRICPPEYCEYRGGDRKAQEKMKAE